MKTVIGNLNDKVGDNNINYEGNKGKKGCGERNENGEHLVYLCTTYDLVIMGSLFPDKEIHKLIWYSPKGKDRNQIDHFVICGTWR